MSVTFQAYDNVANEILPPDFKYEYENDPVYGMMLVSPNPWELNVSNSNFGYIADILGMELDYSGNWKGAVLLEAQKEIDFVLTSLMQMPALDGARQASYCETILGPAIDCGRRAGYYTDVLSRLLHLVNKAIEYGGKVSWA